MKKILTLFTLFIIAPEIGFSQIKNLKVDSAQNNFALPEGYKTVELGAIPQFKKMGKGKQPLLLIAGYGFDASIFDDFMKANKNGYTMYAITVPGFGNTQAQVTPKEGTSFGEQTWNKGVLEGLVKLIDKEKLTKPIVLGHFTTGTQLALRMAIDYPDKVGGVIVIGGPAKFLPVQNGKVMELPLEMRAMGTDKYSGPFFKVVSKATWDSNSYTKELYSQSDKLGTKLWNMQASVPLPVMVRYLCEFQAADVTLEMSKIKCPVLILRPGFSSDLLTHPEDGTVNYIKPQFVDSWESAKKQNPSIEIQDVPNSSTFIWKDQPEETTKHIAKFMREKVNN
jgi:pimeloyl-ACP methyl ester carboxylesterase